MISTRRKSDAVICQICQTADKRSSTIPVKRQLFQGNGKNLTILTNDSVRFWTKDCWKKSTNNATIIYNIYIIIYIVNLSRVFQQRSEVAKMTLSFVRIVRNAGCR